MNIIGQLLTKHEQSEALEIINFLKGKGYESEGIELVSRIHKFPPEAVREWYEGKKGA